MPISNARTPKTKAEKKIEMEKNYRKRKETIGPHVESFMILNDRAIHKWIDDGALKYKIGNIVEVKGMKYKIKVIEREVEGNKIFRRYILNQHG